MNIQTFVCETCKATFSRRPREGRAHRYCSVTCRGIGSRVDLATRFWAKVKKTDGCWYWTGSTNGYGYGQINVGGKPHKAHRIAYELTYGIALGENFGCHNCDTPLCVRPDHIVPGTARYNIEDKVQKQRGVAVAKFGEDHHASKITWKQVTELRAEADAGKPQRALARKYGLSQSTVGSIIRHETWNQPNGKAFISTTETRTARAEGRLQAAAAIKRAANRIVDEMPI